MPESLAAPATARIAFERIVDYAGLFPPAQLSLEEAAAEYERAMTSPHAWMLGRFVVPVRRIDALDAAWRGSDALAATALFDGETPVRSTERVRVQSCEVALRLVSHEAGAPRTAVRALKKLHGALAADLPLAVELPRGLSSTLLAEAMDALHEGGFQAKIRCGGVTENAVPGIAEVADVIRAAERAKVTFKATAGLHHPVRHFNAQAGFVMHGFLNVLAAACAAAALDNAALREIVADEDASSFEFREQGFLWRGVLLAGVSELARVRSEVFTGFGSCSFTEPVDDLITLGAIGA